MDRNADGAVSGSGAYVSLSARRAWIEIFCPSPQVKPVRVALRKESVDRNAQLYYMWLLCRASLSARRAWIEIVRLVNGAGLSRSLSARRAWIEMLESKQIDPSVMVALRKESVDRNTYLLGIVVLLSCRSPQGERG